MSEAGLIRIDMHLHTWASFDCLSDPEAVLATALQRGIDRICVTDHNEVGAALELHGRYPDCVIVGEEVKTAEGVDIIGLYLSERIPARVSASRCCELIREQAGLIYVPHPFGGWRRNALPVLEQIAGEVDVLEGFNARVLTARQNRRAVDWAVSRGLPLGAGSDAHTLREVGRAYVEVPEFEDSPAGLRVALSAGRIVGRRSSAAVRGASFYANLRKRLHRAEGSGARCCGEVGA